MVNDRVRPLVERIRYRLRGAAARQGRARRIMEVAGAELRRALDDDVYGGAYFGEGRNPHDRAFMSGYERYDRDTSNANAAAYLAWRTFPATTSLDIGCATGFVVEALRELGLDARGFDVSPYAIEHAAPGARGHIREGDLRQGLRVPDRAFDLVTAFETLEHLPPGSIPGAVAELARVSAKWVYCTIPSFGPNRNGPGGWYQVKVRDDRVAYYESLGPGYEGPIPFGDLYLDASGSPIEGHLTIASFEWWTQRFADAGLVRCDATERRMHPELARLGLTKYWNLYVFRHADADEPGPGVRSEREIEAVTTRFGLNQRTASSEDLAALEAAFAAAPPLPE